MGPILNGELAVVAGPPAIGKTALLCQIIEHQVLENKKSVLVFNTGMSNEDFILRLICSFVGIDPLFVRTKNLKDVEWEKIARAVAKLQAAKILLCDKLLISPLKIKNIIAGQKNKPDLVIVDYLQCLSGDKQEYPSRGEEYTDIVFALKLLAKDFNIPIIMASYINREIEKRENLLPRVTDLRGFGGLENQADKIIFIHREDYYRPEVKGNRANIILARNKSGRTGMAKLKFNKQTIRFE